MRKRQFSAVIQAILILLLCIPVSSAPSQASGDAGVFKKIIGRWQRPDGGYVIEIKNVSSEGKIDCSYFNPNPIKVSKAAASIENEKIKVFIELRDTGYPGCTYNLIYDSQSDELAGVYYQAAIKESFDVYFVRLKNQ